MSDEFLEQYGAVAPVPQTGDAETDFFAGYPLDALTRPAPSAFTGSPPPPPPMEDALPFQPPPAPRTLEQVLAVLDTLVGLKRIKQEFRRLAQFARVQDAREAKQLTALTVPIHAVFYSAPGAGKSTIAALYGQLLRALGVLEVGHVIETDRLGLVTNMPGQTATRLQVALQRAAGGVLFIDDAPALYKDDYANWDAGGEIIQLLLQAIEARDTQCAIVLAGYPARMQTLVQSHDGLKNYFANHFVFDDYKPAELQTIFERLCQANHYQLTTGAKRKVGRIIAEKQAEHEPAFGNARYIANLFQQVTQSQAMRLGDKLDTLDEAALQQLIADDITAFAMPPVHTQRILGFRVKKDEAE
jgi:stage V sporulation protein K